MEPSGSAGLRAGGDGIGRHLGGIGMRGIDHGVDLLVAQPSRKPFDAAEAADAGGQRLRSGIGGSAGQRQGGVEARVAGQQLRQRRGFGGAAENEDAHCGTDP